MTRTMTRRVSFCFVVLTSCTLTACGGGGGGNGSSNGSAPSTGTVSGPATSSFSGLVRDSSGMPISDVKVTVYLDNDHTEHVTTTDSAGHYTVSGLQAGFQYGQYEIWANKTDYAFLPSIAANEGAVTKSDHWALFKTVIGIGAQAAMTVGDANFTALRSSDHLVNLPRTGQTQNYASNDDAAMASGVAWPGTRFTDNHDGTVTDALTGLVWLQDAGCLGALNWNAALAAANQLAQGTCGLSDGSSAGQWRMPNVGELESLIDISQSNPALSAGHPFLHVGNTYWSSTTYRGDTNSAWLIRFSDGRYINDSSTNAKNSAQGLWAVRSAATAGTISLPMTGQFIVYGARDDATLLKGVRMPYPRFIDNRNGTVTDTVTGLTWLKQADCIHNSWSQSLSDIHALANRQCGLSDGSAAGQWRMPNRLELLSLVDRAETNQALRFNTVFMNSDGSVDQAVVFNSFHESEFLWTSSTSQSNPAEAWTVYSCDYGVYNIDKSAVGYSLAVR